MPTRRSAPIDAEGFDAGRRDGFGSAVATRELFVREVAVGGVGLSVVGDSSTPSLASGLLWLAVNDVGEPALVQPAPGLLGCGGLDVETDVCHPAPVMHPNQRRLSSRTRGPRTGPT